MARENRDVMVCFEQVERHWTPHDSNANKTDLHSF
jgi:hypothetical protein